MQTQPACPHPEPALGQTLVHIVLDETGSMMGIADQTVSKLREYIDGFRNDPNVRFSLTTFDSGRGVRQRFDHQPAAAVRDFDYRPNHGTPLLDAVGSTIRKLEGCLAKGHYDPQPTRVLVVVLTDGQENSSREWKLEDVRRLLDDKQKRDDWAVIFLGAGIDAWANSVGWGGIHTASASRSIGHTPQAIGQTMSNLASATRSYTVGAVCQSNFWEGTDYEDGSPEEDSRPKEKA